MTRALLALACCLSGCATVKTCTEPTTAQAISDGAAVLVCATNGKTLAACEQAQLAVEAEQLTEDLLMCGEAAVVNASKGTHAAP